MQIGRELVNEPGDRSEADLQARRYLLRQLDLLIQGVDAVQPDNDLPVADRFEIGRERLACAIVSAREPLPFDPEGLTEAELTRLRTAFDDARAIARQELMRLGVECSIDETSAELARAILSAPD